MRDEEAALDIVQDAMLRLAEKYGHRPAGELPLLFHRIVQNAMRCDFSWETQANEYLKLFAGLLQLDAAALIKRDALQKAAR